MKPTFYKCVLSGIAVTNPTQTTKLNKYNVKTHKSQLVRNWSKLIEIMGDCAGGVDFITICVTGAPQRFVKTLLSEYLTKVYREIPQPVAKFLVPRASAYP